MLLSKVLPLTIAAADTKAKAKAKAKAAAKAKAKAKAKATAEAAAADRRRRRVEIADQEPDPEPRRLRHARDAERMIHELDAEIQSAMAAGMQARALAAAAISMERTANNQAARLEYLGVVRAGRIRSEAVTDSDDADEDDD